MVDQKRISRSRKLIEEREELRGFQVDRQLDV